MTIQIKEIYTDPMVLEGDTFYRQHEQWHVEKDEQMFMTFSGPSSYEYPVAICDDPDCEAVLDIDPSELVEEPDYEY